MRKFIGILLCGLIALSLFACSESTDQDNIKEFVKEYKTKQYTIEDPNQFAEKHPVEVAKYFREKIEPYLSAEELEYIWNNRIQSRIVEVATITNKSIEVQDVLLDKVEENDDGSIDYEYTLKLNYYDDESSEIFDTEGELTIIDDDGLTITRDWSKLNEFEKEALKNAR